MALRTVMRLAHKNTALPGTKADQPALLPSAGYL
jgi:hypothetical protein